MPRTLAAVVFLYWGLSLAHWCHLASLLRAPDPLWCGNVVTDPYLFLVNVAAPLAAACSARLAWRCPRARRWRALSVAAMLAFLGTSAGLAAEGRWLVRDYGFGDMLPCIWWLPVG